MDYLKDLISDTVFKYMNDDISELEVIQLCKETGISVKDIIVQA